MTLVIKTVRWDNLYGINLRANGMNRQYMRKFARATARASQQQLDVTTSKRWPRTQNLRNSIDSEYAWANQYGVSYNVVARVDYARFVHEGTAGNGAGFIYGPLARGFRGRFLGGRQPLPVGKSQTGRATLLLPKVRGQRANPFLVDGARTVAARWGMLT